MGLGEGSVRDTPAILWLLQNPRYTQPWDFSLALVRKRRRRGRQRAREFRGLRFPVLFTNMRDERFADGWLRILGKRLAAYRTVFNLGDGDEVRAHTAHCVILAEAGCGAFFDPACSASFSA